MSHTYTFCIPQPRAIEPREDKFPYVTDDKRVCWYDSQQGMQSRLVSRSKSTPACLWCPRFQKIELLILTLNKHADDQAGLWLCGEAGQYTDEILQAVRDPIPLSALALSLFIIFDKV
jgi:hypothetical protein